MQPKLIKKMEKLTANELRVGNLINYLGKIVTCDTNTIHAISKVVQPSALYQPIPLTEEILFKFNILRDYDGLFILSDNLKLSLGTDNAKIFYNGIYCLCTIKGFVHTLQNLYWCLCGKELEINK